VIGPIPYVALQAHVSGRPVRCLLMIGSPMDSTGLAGLGDALADRYTVMTPTRVASARAAARIPVRM
jgi:hypothetical protein